MTSQAKQPPRKGGWGSLLSGAVANLESRLDTILAEDNEASARQRASESTPKESKPPERTNSGNLAPPARSLTPVSRDTSRTRVNDRLAERLAKATAAKKPMSEAGSGVPSRVASPANDADSVRSSGESRRSGEVARSVPEVVRPEEETAEMAERDNVEEEEAGSTDGDAEAAPNGDTLLSSGLPINPAKVSEDASRPSVESARDEESARTSTDLPNGHTPPSKSSNELEAEIALMRDDYAAAEKQRQEEMHAYLEKIDALQAKLQYLAKETVAAAKAANADAAAGSEEEKLAEKDERIALLMEEGEKLSKTELRHMQTIKKLRSKATDEEKAAAAVKAKVERAEKVEAELKQKLRRAEATERQADQKAKQIILIEKQVEELRIDRENASELIRTLTSQLKEAKDKADRAQKEANSRAAEADRNQIAALENELEDAQIEKKLAQDRAAAEAKKTREDLDRQRERFSVKEADFKTEIGTLESRVEAMRSRAEEATSETTNSESQVKLLRQVETLQSQYSLAKANWETIESTLNARVAALEVERDDTARRETEVRRKARDAALAKRWAEDELEGAQEEARTLSQELQSLREEFTTLQRRFEQGETALGEAKADLDRQRKLWDTELAQKVEEEKAKWQRNQSHTTSRTDSPATSGRKASVAELSNLHSAGARKPLNRLTSYDLATLHTHNETQRPVSRRSNAVPTQASTRTPYPHPLDRASAEVSPSISRQESMLSLDTPNIPPTPSIEIDQDFEHTSQSQSHSPNRTINDLVSTSTAGAGPSVQLVERMSAAVRRLESEKAVFKDEIARLSTQRDEARTEVVELMREVEGKRTGDAKVGKLEKDLGELKGRYEASLEMLGEREEEVQELKGDVGELRRLYRELVESKMPER